MLFFQFTLQNSEFQTNGCSDPDQTLEITATGSNLVFVIGGNDNPRVEVNKGSCLKVVFDNQSEVDHDFTVVDDTVDPEEELVHMDTPEGNMTTHLWLTPDRYVALTYFCEEPGHDAMTGDFITGETEAEGRFLPGFGFNSTLVGLLFLVSVPVLRSRKK